MNSATDSLIATLVKDMKEVTPAAHPLHLFAGWLAVSFVYVAVLLCFSGLRPDLAAHMHLPGYVAEVGLLALMIVTSGMAAVVISFPDMHQKRWLVVAPLLPLSLFIALLLYELWQQPASPLPPHGIECLLCICMYSFVPGLAMMMLLRRQASIYRGAAGAIALIASASVGCLALRLSEETDSIHHLVVWHYLPMVGFALLGVGLGKKMLNW